MITEKDLKQFNEDGYFILDNFFEESEITEITNRIDHIVQQDVESIKKDGKRGISRANEIIFTPHLVKKDPHFQSFCSQEKFVQLTTKLLGPEVALYWDQAVYKQPETDKDFPWHQDNGYGLFLSEAYITCWIALEDATIENGCIWIKPGTHKQGIIKHKNTPIGWQCYFGDDPGMPVPLKKGSMAVFSSLLFHRSGPNLSDDVRKGYIVQYFPTYTKNMKNGKTFRKMKIAKNGVAHLDTSYMEQEMEDY